VDLTRAGIDISPKTFYRVTRNKQKNTRTVTPDEPFHNMGGDKPWPELPVGNKDHSSAAVVIIGAGISGVLQRFRLVVLLAAVIVGRGSKESGRTNVVLSRDVYGH